MYTLVGALWVDNSESPATSSPEQFFAFMGEKDEESEICPENLKKPTKETESSYQNSIQSLALLEIGKVKQTRKAMT